MFQMFQEQVNLLNTFKFFFFNFNKKGLFDLKVKYDTVIEKSFKGNSNFMKSLNDALEGCVNGFQRFSEFLSKFLDYMIK
jgi:hypothetical protein